MMNLTISPPRCYTIVNNKTVSIDSSEARLRITYLIAGNCCSLQLFPMFWPCTNYQPRCCSWPLTWDDGSKQWDGWDCEQFSASHPVLTQCNPLLPLSLLLSDQSQVDGLFKVWFLVITRRVTRRGTHKCPMGPINCWYPQSQSQPPPKRSITTHNLSLWKLAKNGVTIYS